MVVVDLIRKERDNYRKIEVYDSNTMLTVHEDNYLYYEVVDTDVIDDGVLSVSAQLI